METRRGWVIMMGISNSTITDGVGVPETVKVGDITAPGHVPDIEVFIPELTPNASGELDDNPVKESVEIKNPLTDEKSGVTIPRIQTIRCKYMGGHNHLVPCVHKGEQVWVLQHEGGELSYYWLPMGRLDDQGIRLHEHVRWFAMNQPKSIEGNEAAAVGDGNSYFIDINTNPGQKLIHIHTAINDKEPVGYDIRIAPEKGILEIVDTMQKDANGIGTGNYLRLDSLNTIWKLRNIDESYIELNKTDITISCLHDIKVVAGNDIFITSGRDTTKVVGRNQTTTVTTNKTTTVGSVMDDTAPTINRTGSSVITDKAPSFNNLSNAVAFSGSAFGVTAAEANLTTTSLQLVGAANITLAGAFAAIINAHGTINGLGGW